jgi:hypothetical protein
MLNGTSDLDRMRDLFRDILSLEGVKGVVLFSMEGDVVFKEFSQSLEAEPDHRDWRPLLQSLEGIRETDLLFEKGRLYIRRTEIGYLFVLAGLFAPIAMLRLNCDILLPSLKSTQKTKGLLRLFRK